MKPEHQHVEMPDEIHSQLRQAFQRFNALLFKNSLPRCVVTVQGNRSSAAYLVRDYLQTRQGQAVDAIVINPWFFQVDNDEFVLAAMAHEMCHLWQQAFGTPGRGRYHNAEWAKKMTSLGLTPSHNGQMGGKSTGDRMQHLIQPEGNFAHAFATLRNAGFAIGCQKLASPQEQEQGLGKARRIPGNRMKYTCACFTNFWSKPGVAASCLRCNTPFLSDLA